MIPSNGRAAMSLAEVRIGSGARADMHCHSTASEAAKLGIQRSVGLPECAAFASRPSVQKRGTQSLTVKTAYPQRTSDPQSICVRPAGAQTAFLWPRFVAMSLG